MTMTSTRTRYIARRSYLSDPPAAQRWVVLTLDEWGVGWAMGFFPTRAQARRHAYRLNETSRNRWRRERWRRNKEART